MLKDEHPGRLVSAIAKFSIAKLFNFTHVSMLRVKSADHRQVLQLFPPTADFASPRDGPILPGGRGGLAESSLENVEIDYLTPLITYLLHGQVHKRLKKSQSNSYFCASPFLQGNLISFLLLI